MTKLDAALNDIWDATAVHEGSAAFNAAVLERVARRRALRELMMAAVIAVAVWAVALGLGPVLGAQAQVLAGAATEQTVMASLAVIAAGLGLFAALSMRSAVERGFWTLGLLR